MEGILTVADIFEECGFDAALTPENAFLRDIAASSPVGVSAEAAITAMVKLAGQLDPHPSVRRHLGQALVAHIRILYYG